MMLPFPGVPITTFDDPESTSIPSSDPTISLLVIVTSETFSTRMALKGTFAIRLLSIKRPLAPLSRKMPFWDTRTSPALFWPIVL